MLLASTREAQREHARGGRTSEASKRLISHRVQGGGTRIPEHTRPSVGVKQAVSVVSQGIFEVPGRQ